MSRFVDDLGRVLPGALPMRGNRAAWAQITRERKAITFENVCALATQVVAKKLSYAKTAEKPRLRILPRKDRTGEGNWYVLRAGRWYIRSKTWNGLVRRAAYGPWSRMAHEREAYK